MLMLCVVVVLVIVRRSDGKSGCEEWVYMSDLSTYEVYTCLYPTLFLLTTYDGYKTFTHFLAGAEPSYHVMSFFFFPFGSGVSAG